MATGKLPQRIATWLFGVGEDEATPVLAGAGLAGLAGAAARRRSRGQAAGAA